MWRYLRAVRCQGACVIVFTCIHEFIHIYVSKHIAYTFTSCIHTCYKWLFKILKTDKNWQEGTFLISAYWITHLLWKVITGHTELQKRRHRGDLWWGEFDFSWVTVIRSDDLKLHQGRFRLDMRTNVFPESVVRHWNRLWSKVVQSLSLKVFKKCVDFLISLNT